MYYYIIPFLFYVLTIPLINYNYLLMLRVIVLLFLIAIFRKFYKFRIKFDFLALLTGFVIFLLWILLEGHYPLLGKTSFVPVNNILLMFRLFLFIIITPIIEEFFVRNFLARILIDNNWKKVPLGKFNIVSFIFTVLFFGLSHNRWLPGLITGAILNYLIYKKRDMNSVITVHATANFLLAAYIIATKSWFLW